MPVGITSEANRIVGKSTGQSIVKTAHPGSDFSSLIKRGKMRLRFFLFRRFHQQVKDLFADHRLQQITLTHPRIYEKIYREYITNGATISERLQILTAHYRFVNSVFSDELIRSVYVSQDFRLCTISLPNDNGTIIARLAYRQRFEKEGELTLSLLDDNGKRLYSVSFSIDACDGKPSALIGCLIGPSFTDDSVNSETIKSLTKSMHGMRPKNLLFFVLQVLCREMGIRSIHAIAAQAHVYGGSSKKLERIKFNYDEFWEEVGGQRLDTKLISLPLHHEKRPYEEIKTNKRAAYTRRYALLENIEMDIADTLQTEIIRSN